MTTTLDEMLTLLTAHGFTCFNVDAEAFLEAYNPLPIKAVDDSELIALYLLYLRGVADGVEK